MTLAVPLRRMLPRCPLGVLPALVACALPLVTLAADAPPPAPGRTLPFGAEWAREQGIALPEPFGVGLFAITMRRDIEVTDVRVTIPGNEPVSVSDVASFAVHNDTTLAAVKVDAWILPVLDVYVLAGRTWTDSDLDATITVDRILGPPIVLEATQNTKIDGPLLGAGATLVAGYGRWFVLADADYNYTWIDELDGGGIAAWFISARTGWSGTTGWGGWRGWLGAAYLTTDRTLKVTEQSEVVGEVVVEVDQRPVHPTTLQAGGSLGVGKRWELLLELGSNFDDAFVGVLSASVRF